MSKEGQQALDDAAKAVGKGRVMTGEGGDRKFVVHGQAWRVRVKRKDELIPVAPVNGSPELAPVGFSVSISVAALDDKGNVATDEAGRLLVFDEHPITFNAAALAAGIEPEKLIAQAIGTEITKATAIIKGKAAMADALAMWA